MIRYECDRCGRRLAANDAQRYIVKVEVYAAAGPVELNLDDRADSGVELSRMLQDLAQADPDDIEDKTYRQFRFDVCDACRREVLRNPIGVAPSRSRGGNSQ